MEQFRILIVEDEDDPRDQLAKLLKDAFPSAGIDATETVQEGLQLVESARRAGTPYDIAFLDFKLPMRKGENPEVDESLCREVQRSPNTLIAHITGFPDDPKIKKHLSDIHPPSEPKGFTLNKKDTEYASKLVELTRQYLYGERIERQIERLFRSTGYPSPDFARSSCFGSAVRTEGSLTNAIADVCLDISNHWHELHTTVQQRILQRFDVDTTTTPIKVTLR